MARGRLAPGREDRSRCRRKGGGRGLARPARRDKLAATDAKLRGAVADRSSAHAEKAALERQLKSANGQSGRIAKELEKKVSPVLGSVAWLRAAWGLLQWLVARR